VEVVRRGLHPRVVRVISVAISARTTSPKIGIYYI